MEKIIFVSDYELSKVNEDLENGWKIKMIVPAGHGTSSLSSARAFIVLEKEEK